MSSRKSFDIIIPQLGQPELTLNCLSSLNRYGIPLAQIMLIDNGSSSDDLMEVQRAVSPDLRIVKEPLPGVTACWNCGWRMSDAEVVVLLNNDVVATGDFIKELIQPFEHAGVHATGMRRRRESVIEQMRLNEKFKWDEGIGLKLLQGWCFAVRRSTLLELNGFNSALAMYFSDTDLFLRIQRHFPRDLPSIIAMKSMPIQHLGHQTLKHQSKKQRWWRRDKDIFEKLWSRIETGHDETIADL